MSANPTPPLSNRPSPLHVKIPVPVLRHDFPTSCTFTPDAKTPILLQFPIAGEQLVSIKLQQERHTFDRNVTNHYNVDFSKQRVPKPDPTNNSTTTLKTLVWNARGGASTPEFWADFHKIMHVHEPQIAIIVDTGVAPELERAMVDRETTFLFSYHGTVPSVNGSGGMWLLIDGVEAGMVSAGSSTSSIDAQVIMIPVDIPDFSQVNQCFYTSTDEEEETTIIEGANYVDGKGCPLPEASNIIEDIWKGWNGTEECEHEDCKSIKLNAEKNKGVKKVDASRKVFEKEGQQEGSASKTKGKKKKKKKCKARMGKKLAKNKEKLETDEDNDYDDLRNKEEMWKEFMDISQMLSVRFRSDEEIERVRRDFEKM